MGRNNVLYFLTKRIARIVFSVFYQVTIERETDLPLPRPSIILPKHQFWTDIPLVSLSFREGLYFLAKKELFSLPGIRAFLSSLGGIPVDRGQSVRTLRSFKHLFALLKKGEKIVIFPEGTYVRDSVGLGKSRLIEMILENQPRVEHPILFIPVGIHYGRRTGWRRAVKIRIGRPLWGEKGMDALFLISRAMEEISRLSALPRTEPSSSAKQEVNIPRKALTRSEPDREPEDFRPDSIRDPLRPL